MAIAELPVDIMNSLAGNSFGLGNHALRSAWANSFFLPAEPKVRYFIDRAGGATTLVGYGGVSTGGATISLGTGGSGGFNDLSSVTGVQQVYVDQTGLGYAASAASTSALFPFH